MSEYVKRLWDARNWFNDGRCCGQVDSSGTCAAPACIFGEALKEFHRAAERIEKLEAALKEAAIQISDWGGCASPYVQERCNLSGVVARFIAIADGKSDAALAGGNDDR